LDEVAAHLDATRRAALYDEIFSLGAQAFMTGTGPELFAELGRRAQYAEVTEIDGQSSVVQKDRP
jgi:DNA replication and repair protein RecF